MWDSFFPVMLLLQQCFLFAQLIIHIPSHIQLFLSIAGVTGEGVSRHESATGA